MLDDRVQDPISAARSSEIVEVVDDRAQKRSTAVANQLPFEHWYSSIGDPTIADAIFDSLVHATSSPTIVPAEPCPQESAEAMYLTLQRAVGLYRTGGQTF